MDEPDKLDSFLGLEAAGDFVDSFFEADDDDKRLIFTLEEEEGVLLDRSSLFASELSDVLKLGFLTFEAGPDLTLEAGPDLDDLGPALDDLGPGLLLFGPILGFSVVFLSSSSELELFLLFFLSSLILALLFLMRFFSVL